MHKGQKRGSALAKLDEFGLEAMCEALGEGVSMRKIAKQLGVSLYMVVLWCADPIRVDEIKFARSAAADHFADMAEQALLDVSIEIEDGISGKVAVMRGREMAQHYRWLAKMCDPVRFGDRVAVDLTQKPASKMTDGELDALISELSRKAKAGGGFTGETDTSDQE